MFMAMAMAMSMNKVVIVTVTEVVGPRHKEKEVATTLHYTTLQHHFRTFSSAAPTVYVLLPAIKLTYD